MNAKVFLPETLVCIPYLKSGAQGDELMLAIQGWRKYFRGHERIVVIGDDPEEEGVEWIPCPRVAPIEGEYHAHLDIAHKMRVAIEHFSGDYEGMIWVADDCFAVNPFTLKDVLLPKRMSVDMTTRGYDNCRQPWWKNLIKTGATCYVKGLEMHNYVTHLPRYFEFDKLLHVIEENSLEKNSLVIENMYFNEFPPEGEAVILDETFNEWKYGVYFNPPCIPELRRAFASTKWVNCSEHGWSETFENELIEHYGLC